MDKDTDAVRSYQQTHQCQAGHIHICTTTAPHGRAVNYLGAGTLRGYVRCSLATHTAMTTWRQHGGTECPVWAFDSNQWYQPHGGSRVTQQREKLDLTLVAPQRDAEDFLLCTSIESDSGSDCDGWYICSARILKCTCAALGSPTWLQSRAGRTPKRHWPRFDRSKG